MSVERWLIAIPLGVVALLLQSALWVPRYETQAATNPRRLTTYIEANIGDAEILNPILSADEASSDVESLVYEGLIDIDDETMQWTGRLAERWEIAEEAYLAVLPGRALPDGSAATGVRVAERVRDALAGGSLADAFSGVELLPAEDRRSELSLIETDEQGNPKERRVPVRVELPERVKIRLSRVVPELFEVLAPVVGPALLDGRGLEARVHPEAELAPAALAAQLSELLPLTEHNPVYTFHLRRGVRFHDGEPFDAGDVRFTYQAIMDPKNASPRSSSFEPVKALEVLDDHTVRVVYKRLYSPAVVAWAMGMLPEHRMNDAALEREMERRGIRGEGRASFGLRQSETARHPIGTGSFRFVEWQPDEYIQLARNEEYWKGPPELERVFYRVVPDYITQEVEFRAGAVDSYITLPQQAVRYRKDERFQTVSTLMPAYNYIAYNLRRPLFQDVRVRRALGMAIDVDELVEHVLWGEGQRITGPYYVGTPFYDPSTPPLPYDPEGAKRLLAEAGWLPGPDGILRKDGQRLAFKLITNHGNPQRRAIMTVAQDAWRRIGVEVVTQQFEWTVFLSQFVNALEFDAIVLGWVGGGLDPDIYQLWHSSQAGPMQLNFSGYRSAEADALMERINQEYDLARQIELAFALHNRIAEDQPFTFLFTSTRTWGLDRRLVVIERDAAGVERPRRIEPFLGRIDYHIDRWRKLTSEPVFEAGS
jgi:ABC-type transport system substrate-binding protein